MEKNKGFCGQLLPVEILSVSLFLLSSAIFLATDNESLIALVLKTCVTIPPEVAINFLTMEIQTAGLGGRYGYLY